MVFQIIAIVYHQLRCMPLEEKKTAKRLYMNYLILLKYAVCRLKKAIDKLNPTNYTFRRDYALIPILF